MRATDIIDYDGGSIYLLDDDLTKQTDTIPALDTGRLRPGVGAMGIKTVNDRSYGHLARISVEVAAAGFPAEPADAEFIEESSYLTELGCQRIGDCYFAECQGELAAPLTPPGRARVHVRLYEIPGPHDPYRAAAPGYSPRLVPVNEHLLLHIWNERTDR
ncbi:hypothetical protein [Nocardia sp. XZ_19_369]|uniref:hypothetical protein n=1 Tax=Nocardia sp. XZ_19_369 TaxID=2769487 RepID=UPI00188E83A2|nr:hypothetical protein [Nocardia sp. XZ_19_369]